MKFTFSPKFQKSLYQQFLCELGEEMEAYRLISGINVKDMMAALHISHPILKKC